MSKHRYDDNINELKTYFNTVLDWVLSIFIDIDSTMKGIEWGELYEKYHKNSYNSEEVSKQFRELLSDYYVKDKKGIFEYILGRSVDKKLLNIRVFDEKIKKSVYQKQTNEAKEKGKSNCPLCCLGNEIEKVKIWAEKDMDTDHITAWSKGGETIIDNCQMLCKIHNRSKGNR